MSERKATGYLAQFGPALIDAGYSIVPIKPGEKYPPFDGWQKSHPDREQLAEWLEKGIDYISSKDGSDKHVKVANAGLGIITKNTPGVDIDVSDDDLAKQMENFVNETVGFAPVRIGRAPRRLMLFKASAAFTKLSSQVYLDEFGDPQQIEILGDGQQFVAFHIHPTTGKPYIWTDGDGPHVTPVDELPELTPEKGRAICDEFERLAKGLGWKLKPRKGSQLVARTVDADDDFAMIGANDKPDISMDTLREKVLLIPNEDEDYDTWANMGMAICHHSDGSEDGLNLWIEWSRQSGKHEDEPCERKWPSFIKDAERAEADGRSLITARYVLKLANESAALVATEKFEEVRIDLRNSVDLASLKQVCERIKTISFDSPTREILIGDLKSAFRRVTGQPLGMRAARDMVRFENPEARQMPRWLERWVYMSAEDRFHNVKTQISMSIQAFNNNFSRQMLTKKDVLEGRSVPETMPSHYALNVQQVPLVHRQTYMPGMDELFTMNGVTQVNTYNDHDVPEVPEKLSKRDLRNVGIVNHHFEHLFPIERDRELFKDWLAYIVQNPGQKPNWAVLMQGTEQDGKTFFGMMMGAVLGGDNLCIVDPKSLEENYNSFAEGSQLAFVEEVKLHGHNRYDVLNRIKPLVTNRVIPIRRMRTDAYKILNMTAYLLATNFRDALPLQETDSRYFVLFSRFQTKAAIKAFKDAHPTYYADLYSSIEDSAGAIRGWLLGRELGAAFNAKDRAPESSAKDYMVSLNKSEELSAIEDVLKEAKRWDLSRQLLNATDLMDELVGMDIDVPQGWTIKKLLSDSGFTYLGKFRIAGVLKRFWSQEPERFVDEGVVNTKKIRDWIDMEL